MSVSVPSIGIYPDRVAGGDCHHRHPDRPAAPAVQQAREAARRSSCRNNMKHSGWRCITITTPSRSFRSAGTLGLVVDAHILPYMDQANVYNTLIWQEVRPGNWDLDTSPTKWPARPSSRPSSAPACRFLCSMTSTTSISGSSAAIGETRVRKPSADDQSNQQHDHAWIEVAGDDVPERNLLGLAARPQSPTIIDGTSRTRSFWVSPRPIPPYDEDWQGMDHWYIGSPQADPCACNGGTGRTEITEAVGTTILGITSATSTRLRTAA